MRHVVDARADTPESVVVARDQRRHCRGMLALLADGRAVLAVAGDVEDRAHLALERQGLADIALAARVVDAGRQRRQSALGAVERRGWVQASDHFTSGHSHYRRRMTVQRLLAQQRRHAGALFLQFFEGGVHSLARERIDLEPLYKLVFAIRGRDRKAVHHILGDAIAAV